jgi:hypothetical protein
MCNKGGLGEFLPGKVLGVHPDGSYDIMYDGGEGEMQVAEGLLMPGMNLQQDKENTDSAAAKATKKTSIGWNSAAFGDEPAYSEETVEAAAPVAAPKTFTSTPPTSKWQPAVGDKVESRDFQTKEWKTCKVMGMDAELGTIDLKYEDGVEGKGIPLSLVRERKKKKSSRSSSKASAPAASSESSSAPAPSNPHITEITAMLSNMKDSELIAVKDMLKVMKAFAA